MAEERGANTYCAEHTETPTNVRCSRCDKPVCPACMVQAPVGIRCREHGQAKKLPTYEVPPSVLARAIAAGIGIGIAGGVILGFALPYLWSIPYASLAAIAGLGYLVGEGVSRATNKKRGQSLMILAGACVLAAFAIGSAVAAARTGIQPGLFDLLALGLAVFLAVTRVR